MLAPVAEPFNDQLRGCIDYLVNRGKVVSSIHIASNEQNFLNTRKVAVERVCKDCEQILCSVGCGLLSGAKIELAPDFACDELAVARGAYRREGKEPATRYKRLLHAHGLRGPVFDCSPDVLIHSVPSHLTM
jgi:hypothetical protein